LKAVETPELSSRSVSGQNAAQLVAGLHHLLDLQQRTRTSSCTAWAASLFTRTARTWAREAASGPASGSGLFADHSFLACRPL